MCEFYGSNGNGFGDIWWTDNPIYFSSIDIGLYHINSVSPILHVYCFAQFMYIIICNRTRNHKYYTSFCLFSTFNIIITMLQMLKKSVLLLHDVNVIK